MKRTLMTLAATASVLTACGAATADFAYPDFTAPAGLQLVQNAQLASGRLRVTPAAQGQAGAAWRIDKQALAAGFDTTFTFQVVGVSGYNVSDGFAFVIQNAGTAAIGAGGGAMGYATGGSIPGIANSLAVEFDTWDNARDYPDPDQDYNSTEQDHISIQSRGLAANSVDHTYSLGCTNPYNSHANAIGDGAVHTARIVYQSGVMGVYMDDMATPLLQATVDLTTQLQLDGGKALVGFTAGTGLGMASHEILNWSFHSVPEPASLSLLALGGLAVVKRRRRQA